jgi:hypothetical protein
MAQRPLTAGDHEPAGFAMQWPVREQYRITEGMLVGQGASKWTYAPMERRELRTELAKLQAGDERAVLRFAHRYGPLGYDRLLPDTGEPLAWIWAHALIIRVCLELTGLLDPGSEAALEDYVKRVEWHVLGAAPSPCAAQPPSFPEAQAYDTIQRYQRIYVNVGLPYKQRLYSKAGLNPFHPDADALAVLDQLGTAADWARLDKGPLPSLRTRARRLRSFLINQFMGPIERQLWDQEGTPPRSRYGLRALYNYAYWHLADLVEDQYTRLGRCAACHHWFAQTDARQRFCPPGPGQIGSRCAARERMRKKRHGAA